MDIINYIKTDNCNSSGALWHDKSISFGVEKHKIIENILQRNELSLKHGDRDEAFIKGNNIFLPFKTKFESQSNYYHLVLHETAHYFATKLGHTVDYSSSRKEYISKFHHTPDTDKLLKQYPTKESLKGANPIIAKVLTSYMHEEVKCELAAMQIMEHAKIKLNERDENNIRHTLTLANNILKHDGRDLKVELSENSNSKILNELKEITNVMQKEYDISKEQIKSKERERER